MPILKAGVSNPSTFFNLNGVDYPINLYEVYYSNVQEDENSDIREDVLQVGIKESDNDQNSIMSIVFPALVSDWKNGSDVVYPDLTTLLADIGTLVSPGGGGGSGVTDGDKGDITVSGGGTSWNVDSDSITYDKMQDMTIQGVLGKFDTGTGTIEQLSTLPSNVMDNIAIDASQVSNLPSASNIKLYSDITSLKSNLDTHLDGERVEVEGLQKGIFYYDASDTTSTEDGGLTFLNGTKRFKRVWNEDGIVQASWFGMVSDGSTDNFTQFNNILDLNRNSLEVIRLEGLNGRYKFNTRVNPHGLHYLSIVGEKGSEFFTDGAFGVWDARTGTSDDTISNLHVEGIKFACEYDSLGANTPADFFGVIGFFHGDYKNITFDNVEVTAPNVAVNAFKIDIGNLPVNTIQNFKLLNSNIHDIARMGFEIFGTVVDRLLAKNILIDNTDFNGFGTSPDWAGLTNGMCVSLAARGEDYWVNGGLQQNYKDIGVEVAGGSLKNITLDSIHFDSPDGHPFSFSNLNNDALDRISENITVTNCVQNNDATSGSVIEWVKNVKFSNNKWRGNIAIRDSSEIFIDGDSLEKALVNFGFYNFTQNVTKVRIKNGNILNPTVSSPIFTLNGTGISDVLVQNMDINLRGTTEASLYNFTAGATSADITSEEIRLSNNGVFVNTFNKWANVPETLDDSGFDGNLTTGDDTLQEVAQKFDDYVPVTTGASAVATTNEVIVVSNGIISDVIENTGQEILGPELFTSAWALGTNWLQNGTELESTGSNSFAGARQDPTLVVGKTYRLTFDITESTSGAFRPHLGNTDMFGANQSVVGNGYTQDTEYITPHVPSGSTFQFFAWGDFVGKIDNVSLREVVQLTSTNATIFKEITTATYTLLNEDIGKTLLFTNVAGCVVSQPSPVLDNTNQGWNVRLKPLTTAKVQLDFLSKGVNGVEANYENEEGDFVLEYYDETLEFLVTGSVISYIPPAVYPNEYPDSAGSLDTPTATNIPTFASNAHTVSADTTDPNNVALNIIDGTTSTSYQLLRYNIPVAAPVGDTIRIEYEVFSDTDVEVGITGSSPYQGVNGVTVGDNTWQPKTLDIVSDGAQSRVYFIWRSLTGTGTSQMKARKIKASYIPA